MGVRKAQLDHWPLWRTSRIFLVVAQPLRVEFPDACYHVMNRGLGRQPVFRAETDYLDFVALLEGIAQRWAAAIYAYCCMSTHYHLLLQTPLGNLSRIMRHIDGLYTQRSNRRRRRDGPLFRGRYKAILVDTDMYLWQIVRYIHLNPVRAGLVTDPGAYAWSSHRLYRLPTAIEPPDDVCTLSLANAGTVIVIGEISALAYRHLGQNLYMIRFGGPDNSDMSDLSNLHSPKVQRIKVPKYTRMVMKTSSYETLEFWSGCLERCASLVLFPLTRRSLCLGLLLFQAVLKPIPETFDGD